MGDKRLYGFDKWYALGTIAECAVPCDVCRYFHFYLDDEPCTHCLPNTWHKFARDEYVIRYKEPKENRTENNVSYKPIPVEINYYEMPDGTSVSEPTFGEMEKLYVKLERIIEAKAKYDYAGDGLYVIYCEDGEVSIFREIIDWHHTCLDRMIVFAEKHRIKS